MNRSLKKCNKDIHNPSIKTFVNKIENKITLKIKKGYYLELLITETMKLLGGTKCKITKDKNGDNVPHLEITEVVLVHFNIVNNDYQHDSRVLYTFVPNQPFDSLLEISTRNHMHLKTFKSEFESSRVKFTDQNGQPLEVEDQINLTLIIR